jgi:hypothetical protein
VVAGDAAPLLESVEAAFDGVAARVDGLVKVAPEFATSCPARELVPGDGRFETTASTWLQSLRVPRRDGESQRSSPSVADEANFAGQSAGTPESSFLQPLLAAVWMGPDDRGVERDQPVPSASPCAEDRSRSKDPSAAQRMAAMAWQ